MVHEYLNIDKPQIVELRASRVVERTQVGTCRFVRSRSSAGDCLRSKHRLFYTWFEAPKGFSHAGPEHRPDRLSAFGLPTPFRFKAGLDTLLHSPISLHKR